jgi:hypothetical protein
VPHPDTVELIEHATQGSADAPVQWHIRQCQDCTREVARWKHAIDACVWRDGEGGAGEGCLDDHTIAALADGTMPRSALENTVDHLASCARCRSALASVTHALVSPRVRDEIDRLDRAPRRGWLRVAVPLAAAATLAVILVRDPRVDPQLHRAPSGPAPVTIAPNGPTSSVQVLRWHAVTGADRYRVTVFGEEGSVLWEGALDDTVVALPADVTLQPGRSYYWTVSARTGFDRWDSSELVEFSVAAGNR